MCHPPGAFCFAAPVRDTLTCASPPSAQPARPTYPHSCSALLSGQSQSRIIYCPEMPTVPSYLNTKDIFKWRENNVFTANVSCIFCSLPHTHDVALRVLLQVGLYHPCRVLSVSHDPAKEEGVVRTGPAQFLSLTALQEGTAGRARRSGVSWRALPLGRASRGHPEGGGASEAVLGHPLISLSPVYPVRVLKPWCHFEMRKTWSCLSRQFSEKATVSVCGVNLKQPESER